MYFSKKLPIQFFMACFILSSLQISPAFAQSNSDYLNLLESEASNTIVDKKTYAKQKKEAKQNLIGTFDGEGFPSGLSIDSFLNHLKVNYIGTYFFAMRLSKGQKNEIYSFYQKNNDPQAIRTKIIEISKKN